jgi:nucleotide-binding universal stress UspA family protein
MLEEILLAVDMSDHARKAVPAAAELAKAGGGTVHVLHVLHVRYYPVPPTVVGDSPEEAQQLVDSVVEELKKTG